jgi:hypothetical protein
MRSLLIAAGAVAVWAAPAAAHPGPRVWIGNDNGTLVTYTSDNDLAPTSFAPGKLFIGGVDEDTRIPNGMMEEFPASGSGVYATNFPGYQVRSDLAGNSAGGGLGFGTTVGFKTAGPLLVFDEAMNAYRTTQQVFGDPGPAPQFGLSLSSGAGGTVVTANGPVNGFNFYSYNGASDHAHPIVTMLPQGVVPPSGQAPGDGPHAVYALPLRLTAAGYTDSLPFVILYGRGFGYPTDSVFTTARAVAATSYGLPGDANLDGQVDVADLGILASHWQLTGFWTDGDFDNSGLIDVADLGTLASNWQAGVESFNAAVRALPPGIVVPEPVLLVPLLAAQLLTRTPRFRSRARSR